MTLKSIMRVACDTKYLIVAHTKDCDDYRYIEIDYVGASSDDFVKALKARKEIEAKKHRVTFVHFNMAHQALEIDVELAA